MPVISLSLYCGAVKRTYTQTFMCNICTRMFIHTHKSINKNEVLVACGTYGREVMGIQGFGGKTWRKETT
jgi:hypothetical protein